MKREREKNSGMICGFAYRFDMKIKN